MGWIDNWRKYVSMYTDWTTIASLMLPCRHRYAYKYMLYTGVEMNREMHAHAHAHASTGAPVSMQGLFLLT